MLRVSDGRMSGTAGGTVVLHVSPESADPRSVFGIVQDGDIIRVDVEARILSLELDAEEIGNRLAEREARTQAERQTVGKEAQQHWVARESMRGYRGLYMRSVNQAEEGADFDFLTARGPRSS